MIVSHAGDGIRGKGESGVGRVKVGFITLRLPLPDFLFLFLLLGPPPLLQPTPLVILVSFGEVFQSSVKKCLLKPPPPSAGDDESNTDVVDGVNCGV